MWLFFHACNSFLPCDALRCTVFVIVILSVCLSHSWTVSTWFDLRSWFLYQLYKLQRVQNSLAHIILGLDTQSSTMQNLADRLWLPVRTRINSKIAFFMFKTLASCHWATCLSVWTTSVPHNAMTPPFQRPSSAPWRRGQNRLWQLWFFWYGSPIILVSGDIKFIPKFKGDPPSEGIEWGWGGYELAIFDQ